MKVWVNEERTVLVRTWREATTRCASCNTAYDDVGPRCRCVPVLARAGSPASDVMEVATREDPGGIWGPPIRCLPERT